VSEEWVVLVDDDDRELGVARKAEVHHAATPLHRAFSLFLFDDRGQTLLQRRSLTKRTWPGIWSNACCGHPQPGESTIDAVRRRSREELGVDLLDLRVALPDFRYRAELAGVVENELCPVYVGRLDGQPLRPAAVEVAATRWVGWSGFFGQLPGEISPWCAEEAALLESSPEFRLWLSSESGVRQAADAAQR
jgi:isopentenyl-diphosphate delta-isomerase type 1